MREKKMSIHDMSHRAEGSNRIIENRERERVRNLAAVISYQPKLLTRDVHLTAAAAAAAPDLDHRICISRAGGHSHPRPHHITSHGMCATYTQACKLFPTTCCLQLTVPDYRQ